jgi:hypothetical protein
MDWVQQGEMGGLGEGAGERAGNQRYRGEGIGRESVGAGGASRRPELEIDGKREVCLNHMQDALVDGRGISFYLSLYSSQENAQQGELCAVSAYRYLSNLLMLGIYTTCSATKLINLPSPNC